MKKLVIIIFMMTLLGSIPKAEAQVLDPEYGPRAWQKENTKQLEAVTLTHIREADVMWSTRIWRTLDLRQKQNLPLYYPIADSATLGKRSFIQVIYDEIVAAVDNPGPNSLRMYNDYQLRNPIPTDQIMSKILKSDTMDRIIDPVTCEAESYEEVLDFFTKIKPEIIKVKLMEDWFFDKQHSVMDVRILALAIEIPIYTSKVDVDAICGITVFGGWDIVPNATTEIWFYFPDLRPTMAANECYKRSNDAARISFDDIFLKRMFASYIIKEENVYDRGINEYTNGLDALLEAEKISEKIRDFEGNFWQY